MIDENSKPQVAESVRHRIHRQAEFGSRKKKKKKRKEKRKCVFVTHGPQYTVHTTPGSKPHAPFALPHPTSSLSLPLAPTPTNSSTQQSSPSHLLPSNNPKQEEDTSPPPLKSNPGQQFSSLSSAPDVSSPHLPGHGLQTMQRLVAGRFCSDCLSCGLLRSCCGLRRILRRRWPEDLRRACLRLWCGLRGLRFWRIRWIRGVWVR